MVQSNTLIAPSGVVHARKSYIGKMATDGENIDMHVEIADTGEQTDRSVRSFMQF